MEIGMSFASPPLIYHRVPFVYYVAAPLLPLFAPTVLVRGGGGGGGGGGLAFSPHHIIVQRQRRQRALREGRGRDEIRTV